MTTSIPPSLGKLCPVGSSFQASQALALDTPFAEYAFEIESFVHFFLGVLGRNLNDDLVRRTEAVLEARADDVDGALVGVVVKYGLTNVGDASKPITEEWFAHLRLMFMVAGLSKLHSALYAHDIINVVCRLMRRLARQEIPAVEIPMLGTLMRMALLALESLLLGPLAAREALEAHCLPTLLRMHAAFAQTQRNSVTPPDGVDDGILPFMSTIRGYIQIPSFRRVIAKSLRCTDRMMNAKTNALKISGRVEVEYRAICRHFTLLEKTLVCYSVQCTFVPGQMVLQGMASRCPPATCCEILRGLQNRCLLLASMPAMALGGRKPPRSLSSAPAVSTSYVEHSFLCCIGLMSRIFPVTLPYNQLGYVDLATISLMASARLRDSTSEWRQLQFGPGQDVLVEDLSKGTSQIDDLQRILNLESSYFDAGHWRELAKRRVPKNRTFPYVLLMIGRCPLELTRMNRLLDGHIDVELFTTDKP